jgi:hypothetical protein
LLQLDQFSLFFENKKKSENQIKKKKRIIAIASAKTRNAWVEPMDDLSML